MAPVYFCFSMRNVLLEMLLLQAIKNFAIFKALLANMKYDCEM
jgi:hypothetical protein